MKVYVILRGGQILNSHTQMFSTSCHLQHVAPLTPSNKAKQMTQIKIHNYPLYSKNNTNSTGQTAHIITFALI